MTEKNKVILTAGITLGVGLLAFMYLSHRGKKRFKTFAQVKSSGTGEDILWKVIAREGKSKNYKDVIALDGGTVGIAHFAVGGLGELYTHMNTEKYFGKSRSEMIANYSSKCRPSGRSGNDTGWGCYSKSWWKQGMINFVNSPDSKRIQKKAWLEKMRPVIEEAISHGWNTPRQMAIATGVANSLGGSGFRKLAQRNNWDAEKTLNAYAGNNAHRLRRKASIDTHFKR